ncbi:MAG: methyltransferase domain-containing protein, partial [Planctomycetota bacterium]|nr:methyltransferase domain-containing protein [Planctomycetota bacterium]
MSLDTDAAVRARYSDAAQSRETELCCPVSYNPEYLEIIPDEVLERDYGCGDPSACLRDGETVLDLGSGGGKICFIAGQVVGPSGHVIGVDMNPEMLALARSALPKTGLENVEFREGRIQDLTYNAAEAARFLAERPVRNAQDALALQEHLARHPLVADESVDVVVSNCVLNLVSGKEKTRLFREIYRVVKNGGRAVISDIVSDEPVPVAMQADSKLWSGCISGAMR